MIVRILYISRMNKLKLKTCLLEVTERCFYIKKIDVVTQEIGHCMKDSVTVVQAMNFLGILQDHHVPK